MTNDYEFIEQLEFRLSKLAIPTILLLSTVWISLVVMLLTNKNDMLLEKSIFAIFLVIFPFMIRSASRFWLVGLTFKLNEEKFETYFLIKDRKINTFSMRGIEKFVEKRFVTRYRSWIQMEAYANSGKLIFVIYDRYKDYYFMRQIIKNNANEFKSII